MYMHILTHAQMDACIQTYIHTYIHAPIHTYAYVSMYVQEFLYQVKKKFPRMKVNQISLSHGIHKTM